MTTWPSTEEDLLDAWRVMAHQSGPQPPAPHITWADQVTRLPWVDRVECHEFSEEEVRERHWRKSRFACVGRDTFRGDIWSAEPREVKLDEREAWQHAVVHRGTTFAAGPLQGTRPWPPPEVSEGPFGSLYAYDLTKPGSAMHRRVKCYAVPHTPEAPMGEDNLDLYCRVGHRKFDEDLQRVVDPREWERLFRKLREAEQ